MLVLTNSILHMYLQVVMLDENGKEISSEQMAELVADAGNTVCTAYHLQFESNWLFRYHQFISTEQNS